MTTIAYKDGLMASDSLVSSKSWAFGGVVNQKIYVTGGGLVGLAGSADEAATPQEWLDAIQSEDDVAPAMDVLREAAKGEYTVLFVFNDSPDCFYMGNVFEDEKEFVSGFWSGELQPGYGIAIGSGDEVAMAAMSAGQSADEAVRTAMKFDPSTGGVVDMVFLDYED